VKPALGYVPLVPLGTPSIDPYTAMNAGLKIAGHTIALFSDKTGPPNDLDVLIDTIQCCSGIFVSSIFLFLSPT
jgi:hypothetical protein